MAVLLSYHKLVERDSKHVDPCWKCTTICVLVLTAVCCIAGSWSLQKLITVYDNHCILQAELKFKQNITSSVSDAEVSAFSVANTAVASRFEGTDSNENSLDRLSSNKTIIDDKETKWGKTSTCDYAVFIPIFQFCFGIIITVMFVICEKGGKAEQTSFLPQPWRIVAPSTVFFLIMTCISIANLTSIQSGLNVFCEGLTNQSPGIGCLAAIENFAIIKSNSLLPSTLYIALVTFSWILMFCWIALLTIMIARMFFIVDFQLVRVTIKTCESENERTSFKVVEPQEEDKNGNDIDVSIQN